MKYIGVSVGIFVFLMIAIVVGFVVILTQPFTFASVARHQATVSPESLKNHVAALVDTPAPRNYSNLASLDQAGDHIQSTFSAYKCDIAIQEYEVWGRSFRNISCIFQSRNDENKTNRRIVIGAHYDAFGDQDGADDNASGVAGMLELARLLDKTSHRTHDIELVAYTLEEPPFFRTEDMGSFRHARQLKSENVPVSLMVSLEMIGYFSDKPNSQHYSPEILGLLYPTKGNFIALISLFDQQRIVRQFKGGFKANSDFPIRSINAPAWVPGIDFSDHLNYWQFDIPALMVTDTSYLRNENYHQPTDTIDTLDFPAMAQVVQGVYGAILNFR